VILSTNIAKTGRLLDRLRDEPRPLCLGHLKFLDRPLDGLVGAA